MAAPQRESSRANAFALAAVAERKFWLDVPKDIIMYLDDPGQVVLNASKQAAFFAQMKTWGITYIVMYSMSSLCVPANYLAIQKFIAAAIAAGIRRVGGVYGSTSTVDKMVLYQNTAATDYVEQLSMFLEEWEVWNNGGWAGRVPSRQYVWKAGRGLTTPAIKFKANVGTYFGWFTKLDSGMTAAQGADGIVANNNKLLLHQYRNVPSWSNLLERTREFDNSCQRLNRGLEIYPLISGESKSFKEKDGTYCTNEFSGQYLKTKKPIDWYNEVIAKVKAYYDSSGDSGFKKITIAGIAVFDYWWLKQARP